MNSYQQKVVSDRIKADANFVNVYGQEMAMKRKMRMDSIETAMRIFVTNKEVPSAETVVDSATKIYNYLIQDGGLDTLGGSDIKII